MPKPTTLTVSLTVIACIGLLTYSVVGAGTKPDTKADGPAASAQDEFDETSYALGYVVSHRLAQLDSHLDIHSFAEGFAAARGKGELRVSHERMQQLIDELTARQRTTEAKEKEQEQAAASDAAALTEAQRRQQAEARRAIIIQAQQDDPDQMYLRLNGRVPPDRINTAVPATRQNTREADDPNLYQQP